MRARRRCGRNRRLVGVDIIGPRVWYCFSASARSSSSWFSSIVFSTNSFRFRSRNVCSQLNILFTSSDAVDSNFLDSSGPASAALCTIPSSVRSTAFSPANSFTNSRDIPIALSEPVRSRSSSRLHFRNKPSQRWSGRLRAPACNDSTSASKRTTRSDSRTARSRAVLRDRDVRACWRSRERRHANTQQDRRARSPDRPFARLSSLASLS